MRSISIIIPVKKINDYVRESISYILDLDYQDYEVLILPDQGSGEAFPRTRIIPTGQVGPAEKRDSAMKYAKGGILAFIDDDAYPDKNWLKEAIKHFEDIEVAAVGGPAVTPGGDSLLQKASGCVYSSFLGGGSYRYRYIPMEKREVDDYPSCNFIVRKEVFEKLGGFDTTFWPGEDTKLCLQITDELKKKIIYDPKVLVYHHRRKLFTPHLRQVWSYALHRGYFAKKFPKTSLRVSYFLPSLLLLGVLVGVPLSLVSPIVRVVFIFAISIYLVLTLASSLNSDLRLIALIFLGIILTHFTYGVGFIKGLTVRRLER